MKYIKSFNNFDNINESNNKLNSSFINQALRSYLTAAIWAEQEQEGFDDIDYTDIDIKETKKAKNDIRTFLKKVYQENLLDVMDASQFGHDFWLTRNGHGAGFWDRSYENDENGDIGDRLTKIAKSFGEVELYKGDDGKPYFS